MQSTYTMILKGLPHKILKILIVGRNRISKNPDYILVRMLKTEMLWTVQVQNNLQDVENGGRTPKARQKINLGENDEMVSKTTFHLSH